MSSLIIMDTILGPNCYIILLKINLLDMNWPTGLQVDTSTSSSPNNYNYL